MSKSGEEKFMKGVNKYVAQEAIDTGSGQRKNQSNVVRITTEAVGIIKGEKNGKQ